MSYNAGAKGRGTFRVHPGQRHSGQLKIELRARVEYGWKRYLSGHILGIDFQAIKISYRL